MKKILILGAGGFLGSYLSKTATEDEIFGLQRTVQESNSYILRFPKGETKVLSSEYLKGILVDVFTESGINIVINCIANTSAEHCELKPSYAYHVNSEIPLTISQVANQFGVKVIQISTDAVFGQLGSYFKPDEVPYPKSIYGKSKLKGEVNVLESNSNNLVIRTNFFGFYRPKITLFNYFFDNLVKKNPVIGFSNQFFTPMYVEDLAFNILNIAKNHESGIVHLGGNFNISKYDLALHVAGSLNLPSSLVIPEIYENKPDGPLRNLNISLDSSKSAKWAIKNSSIEQGVLRAVSLGYT